MSHERFFMILEPFGNDFQVIFAEVDLGMFAKLPSFRAHHENLQKHSKQNDAFARFANLTLH